MRVRKGSCLFCGASPQALTRGLCQRCYRDPEIRDQYPSQREPWLACDYCHARLAERGGLCRVCATDPEARARQTHRATSPTTAAPGSVEKLAVLASRAATRQALFHPADSDESAILRQTQGRVGHRDASVPAEPSEFVPRRGVFAVPSVARELAP